MATEWEDALIQHGIIAPREIPRAPTAREFDTSATEIRETIDGMERSLKIAK